MERRWQAKGFESRREGQSDCVRGSHAGEFLLRNALPLDISPEKVGGGGIPESVWGLYPFCVGRRSGPALESQGRGLHRRTFQTPARERKP